MSTRQIDLVFQLSKYPTPNSMDGFRLTCTAQAPVGFIDTYIFRYERIPIPVPDEDTVDVFNGVCSPADLEEFPIGAPDPESQHPTFFRKYTVDIVFRSSSEGQDTFEAIQEDVERLIKSLDNLDALQPATTITIGPFT